MLPAHAGMVPTLIRVAVRLRACSRTRVRATLPRNEATGAVGGYRMKMDRRPHSPGGRCPLQPERTPPRAPPTGLSK